MSENSHFMSAKYARYDLILSQLCIGNNIKSKATTQDQKQQRRIKNQE